MALKNSRKVKTATPQLAKLTAPVMPRVVERARLFRALDRAVKKPVTWITAPPGAGKTTLVASYLKARKRRTLWYRLDEGDADLSSFFYYLAQAAQYLAPRRKDSLPALTPDYFLGLATFVRRFFERLCERLPRPCVIVFENYQEVSATASLHELLPLALGEIPRQVSVIVMSREVPPAAYARLEAEQRLISIGAESLQLTQKETKELVLLHQPRLAGRALREAMQLAQVSQGWVAGVILLLSQVKTDGVVRAVDSKASLPTIFRYLAVEAFDRTAPEHQTFLLQTSLLPEMTAEMAVALTGYAAAGDYLASLYRARCFTERVQKEQAWYRYHPLFRGFLLELAAKRYQPDELARLRREGARLFIDAGHCEEGVALLRAAEDWDGVARQALALAPGLIKQGRFRTLEVWLDDVLTKPAGKEPWITYWLAICRLPSDPAQSQRLLEAVLQRFKNNNDVIGRLAAWSGIVSATTMQLADYSDLDRWIAEFPYQLPEDLPPLPPEFELPVIDAMGTALVWRQPGLERSDRWVAKVADLKTRFAIEGQILPLFFVETYYLWKGDFRSAHGALQALINGLSKRRSEPVTAGFIAYAESVLAWYEGDAEGCRKTIDAAFVLSEREGTHVWLDNILCFQGAYNELFAGNLNRARGLLDKIRPPSHIKRGMVVSHYRFIAGWFELQSGNYQDAFESCDPDSCSPRVVAGPFPEALHCLLAAYAKHGLGDAVGAERFRARAEETAEWMNSDLLRHGVGFLNALIAFDRSDDAAGYAALRKALEIGRRRGLMGCPGWHSPSVARLCAKALEAGIEVEYVKTLLRKRWLPLPDDARHIDAWPWPVKIYTLGKYEVLVNDEPLAKKRKAPHRLMDFLKALIAFGGSDIPTAKIMDALWPRAEGDAAKETLDKTLQRLRHLLGHGEALTVKQSRISLNKEICWVDAFAFETLAIENSGTSAGGAAETSSRDRAVALYRGSFLRDQPDAPWTDATRDRLRRKYSQVVIGLAQSWQKDEEVAQAIDLLRKAIQTEPVEESFYFQLMTMLARMGRKQEAANVYNECCKVLEDELGMVPSPRMKSLWQSLGV